MSATGATTALAGAGTDILKRWRDEGRAPGFADLLGFSVESFGEGAARLVCAITPDHSNLMGGVHGGVMAALVDAATGCALMTLIGPNEQFATTDVQVRYLRGAPAGVEMLYADATIMHRGRRLAVVECAISGPDGTVHSHGTASLMLTPRPSA